MLLGFMSPILAVAQTSISKICIPTNPAVNLPCRKPPQSGQSQETQEIIGNLSSIHNLWRQLAGTDDEAAKKIPLQFLILVLLKYALSRSRTIFFFFYFFFYYIILYLYLSYGDSVVTNDQNFAGKGFFNIKRLDPSATHFIFVISVTQIVYSSHYGFGQG